MANIAPAAPCCAGAGDGAGLAGCLVHGPNPFNHLLAGQQNACRNSPGKTILAICSRLSAPLRYRAKFNGRL